MQAHKDSFHPEDGRTRTGGKKRGRPPGRRSLVRPSTSGSDASASTVSPAAVTLAKAKGVSVEEDQGEKVDEDKENEDEVKEDEDEDKEEKTGREKEDGAAITEPGSYDIGHACRLCGRKAPSMFRMLRHLQSDHSEVLLMNLSMPSLGGRVRRKFS